MQATKYSHLCCVQFVQICEAIETTVHTATAAAASASVAAAVLLFLSSILIDIVVIVVDNYIYMFTGR